MTPSKNFYPGGKTFYKILITLLSCVLMMTFLTSALIVYTNRKNVKTHVDLLESAMANGTKQIDTFWENANLFFQFTESNQQLARLSFRSRKSLKLNAQAQRSSSKALSAFNSSVECVRDTFIFLYDKDYLITADGITEFSTYFNHRFSGNSAQCRAFLSQKFPFKLQKWPYSLITDREERFKASDFALIQTLYTQNQPFGTLVMMLDGRILENTMQKFLNIPDVSALLLLNGQSLHPSSETQMLLSSIPEGDYSRYISQFGVIARKESSFFPEIEYLAVNPKENIMPEQNKMVTILCAALAFITIAMGISVFFAARRLYAPFQELLKSIDDPVGARTDECKLLLKTLQNANENYKSTKNELDHYSPMIRDALLYRLLWGTSIEESPFTFRYLSSPSSQKLFYVFVLASADFSGDDENMISRELLSHFQSLFKEFLLSAIRTNEHEFSFITCPIEKDQYHLLCASLQKSCENNDFSPESTVICACGKGVPDIEQIGVCFKESRKIIQERPVTFTRGFFDESVLSASPHQLFHLPFHYPSVLSSLLQEGDYQKTWSYIKSILEKNVRPDVSASQFLQIAFSINQQICFAALTLSPGLSQRMISLSPDDTLMPTDQIFSVLQDNLRIFFPETKDKDPEDDPCKIIDYIQQEFSSGVNLNSTAAHFGYNANYFSRYFKQRIGVNFMTYLNKVRIDHACSLLKESSSLTVLDISKQCGFDSVNQFIATFKKQTGMTPGAYRKIHYQLIQKNVLPS